MGEGQKGIGSQGEDKEATVISGVNYLARIFVGLTVAADIVIGFGIPIQARSFEQRCYVASRPDLGKHCSTIELVWSKSRYED